ncbi:MAG: nucleotidyltransferase family protein [Bacteroidales bacterium]|nr:nucleotidyltransferase family protein [Bacteroidales bacterium]
MREAIVLAGGFGTRLRSEVSDVPKPLAPVRGTPFVCYVLDYLASAGFRHVVLSTGYMHEKIESALGANYAGLELSYAVEEVPLGTGGGMLWALQQCKEEVVTVVNGDTLFRADLLALADSHERHQAELSVMLRSVSDASRYGRVEMDGDGRIVRFAEKSAVSAPGLINGGIYCLCRSLFDGFQPGSAFSFERDVMQAFVDKRRFYGMESDGYFIDIGIPEDYRRAQQEL